MQVFFSFDDEVLLSNLLSRVEKGSLFSFRIPGNKFKFKKKKEKNKKEKNKKIEQ